MSSSIQRSERLAVLRRKAFQALLAAAFGLLASSGGLSAAPVEVFAEFASGAGAAGIREVRMWVGGEEVTDRSAVSPVRISYALPGDFPTGSHEVRVLIVDALGREHEKSWTFEHEGGALELVAFFSDELLVELDRVPRRLLADRLRLSGSSLPEVEIEIRVDGAPALRTSTTASGRFEARLPLEPGPHEIGVAALRPWTGEEGREVRVRLERVPPRPGTEPEGEEEIDPEIDPRAAAEPPGAGRAGRAGRDAPDAPGDRSLPGEDPPLGEVVITKPDDGEVLRGERVTVLGRAPAGWRVEILVEGRPGGSDVANPAGRFTVPQVRLSDGANELVAEAEDPATGRRLVSEPVVVQRRSPQDQVTLVAAGSRAVSRDGSFRVQGRAWPGALLEVELNGRLVGTESARLDGGFSFLVPVERGLNSLVVEAYDPRSGRSERSAPLRVRGLAPARRVRPALGDDGPPRLVRPELPGRSSRLGRLRPLD